MSEELKPCPFCGNEASIKDVVVYPNCEKAPAYVGCKNHCAGGSGYDLQDTINRWNNRPIEDALRARIAALEAENERLEMELLQKSYEAEADKVEADQLRESNSILRDSVDSVIKDYEKDTGKEYIPF